MNRCKKSKGLFSFERVNLLKLYITVCPLTSLAIVLQIAPTTFFIYVKLLLMVLLTSFRVEFAKYRIQKAIKRSSGYSRRARVPRSR